METLKVTKTKADEVITVMLLGKTGSGKSLLANTLCGLDGESCSLFDVAEGCIKGRKSTEPQASTAKVSGTKIRVIDTPGFFDSEQTVNARWFDILKALCLAGNSLDAIILVISIYHIAAGADCFQVVKQHIVDCATERMVIVFTFADEMDESKRRKCIKLFNEDLKTGALGASFVFTDQKADRMTISQNMDEIAELLKEVKKYSADHIEKKTLAKQTRVVVEAGLDRMTQVGDITYEDYCDHMKIDIELLPLFIEKRSIDDMISKHNENRQNEEVEKHKEKENSLCFIVACLITSFVISGICELANYSFAANLFGLILVCMVIAMIVHLASRY